MLQLLQAGASRSFASLDDHRPWQDAAAERRRAPSLARARVRPSGPSSCYKGSTVLTPLRSHIEPSR